MPPRGETTNADSVVLMPAELVDRMFQVLDHLARTDRAEFAEFEHLLTTRAGELSLPQRQLALRYAAFQTALGRIGAAAVVVGEVSGDQIRIVSDNVPDGKLWLVAYGTKGTEIGRGPLTRSGDHDGPRHAEIKGLRNNTLTRFEVWDKPDRPVLFGVPRRGGR